MDHLKDIFKTDKFNHGYMSIYESHLSKYVFKNEFTLLEIGVKKRAAGITGCESLKLWRNFFPKARIIGLDIIDLNELQLQNTDIELYQVDCTKFEHIIAVLNSHSIKPDVVIDDGAHTPESHQISFSAIFPYLLSGGVYFIEDLQTCFKTENFERWQVNNENNTFKWLDDLSNKKSNSVFLSPEQNSRCIKNIQGVKFYCNKKLAMIEKKP
jgi:hypothetical protein